MNLRNSFAFIALILFTANFVFAEPGSDSLRANSAPSLPPMVSSTPTPPFNPRTNMVWIEGREIKWTLADASGKLPKPEAVKRASTGFFIDRSEVTNRQFAQFLSAADSNALFYDSHMDIVRVERGKYLPRFGREEFPVAWVDWIGAYAFAKWAGKSLPTEDEWMIATLDGRELHPNEPLYPWSTGGADSTRCNSLQATGFPGAVAVASYLQGMTSTGIVDLAGNVAEWTLSVEKFTAPAGSANSFAVVKGGSFLDPIANMTVTSRTLHDHGERLSSVGFRCILRERRER